MKKCLYLLLALSCILANSCKKHDDPTDVYYGYDHLKCVIQNTNTPVPGATVYFQGISGPISTYLIDEKTTDLNGEVTWLKNREIMSISATANGYWNMAQTDHDIDGDFLEDRIFEMSPKAYINIDAHDNEPYNPEVVIEHSGGYSGNGDYFGLADDFPVVYPWVGYDNEYTLYIRYYHTVPFDYVLDSTTSRTFWVEPHDTLRWTLYY